MAGSATRRNADTPTTRCVALAYSGGRDSTALLHATLRAARALQVRVVALHVHHGLSANADRWLDHCRRTCTRWRARGAPLAFAGTRIEGAPAARDSIEAWARRARYGALRTMALEQGASCVLLAHHRRDQAETFLLQALRAGGVAGIAAMPRIVEREGIVWMRPWLDVPHRSIEAYVKRHRLRFITDDSNADVRFARNRLRNQLWPALIAAFPDAEATLARAAGWAQQAHDALAELASLDLQRLTKAKALDLAAWRQLSLARRSNALRAWLTAQSGRAPPASLVERLLNELDQAGSGAAWPAPPGRLRCYRGLLHWEVLAESRLPVRPALLTLDLHRTGMHRLAGWAGRVRVEPVRSQGVALARLHAIEARPRSGSERFQLGFMRPARPLKKQYQSLGVSSWQRDGPLLYASDRLIFAPGLGIDARAWEECGKPQASLRWIPDSAQPDG